MTNIRLPNVRKQFIPDPGMLIVDVDLSGADAQVVAWEADDEDMKQGFRDGVKIHIKNTRDMAPEWADKSVEEIKANKVYKEYKILCHATNYVGSAPPLAAILKWPVALVEDFQRKWFQKHPGILEWHNRIERNLAGTQCWNCNSRDVEGVICDHCGVILGNTVKNAFGYRVKFLDRVDRLLPEAVAWIPQSTVAIVTARGMLLLDEKYPFVQGLLQVHDSLVFQLPISEESTLKEIEEDLNKIKVPYSDPLYIPWGIATSRDTWGDCG